ncbi:MAG: DegV family protein [Oscillospiraceae bacterium]|nr:DegV family protein [Oscillospiraceae bacterium]
MKEYKLFTDSTSDLPYDIVKRLDIEVIPTEVILKGKGYLDYPDERELNKRDFYRQVREGEMPTTAVIPPNRFYEYFEKELKEGRDILYIVFSSGLTTTLQNAKIAAAELKEVYPEGRIALVDSLSGSLGEGLLVYYAAEMRQEGKSIDEIEEWVKANRLKLCHWFTVDDLQHLRRGGRVTAASAVVGGVLSIKPILNVSDEGRLEPVEKVRGRKAALETLLDKIKKGAVKPEEQTIFIIHADCEEECMWLKAEVEKHVGPKEIFIAFMGPVVGAHAGPGAIGLVFIGEHR